MNIEFSYSELAVCVLTIIASALGYIIKRQHDKIQVIQNQISEKKYEVYNEIFGIFFDLMRQGKGYKLEGDKNLPNRIIRIKKELLIYGTDDIIKQFTIWHTCCNSPTPLTNMKHYLKLFTLIRKDMGYKNTRIKEKEILRFIMGDDYEFEKFITEYQI